MYEIILGNKQRVLMLPGERLLKTHKNGFDFCAIVKKRNIMEEFDRNLLKSLK